MYSFNWLASRYFVRSAISNSLSHKMMESFRVSRSCFAIMICTSLVHIVSREYTDILSGKVFGNFILRYRCNRLLGWNLLGIELTVCHLFFFSLTKTSLRFWGSNGFGDKKFGSNGVAKRKFDCCVKCVSLNYIILLRYILFVFDASWIVLFKIVYFEWYQFSF